MSEEVKRVRCRLCGQEHEVMMLHGMEFIPCSEMPENIIMPLSTLDAFLDGQSMLDRPFIVLK